MKEPSKYSERELNKIWKENLEGWGSTNYFAALIPSISKYLYDNNSNGSLLDLGCGYGYKSKVFYKMGFDVTGIDSDPDRISKAVLTYPNIKFDCHKIKSTLPFKDNTFDVIFSCSVFQYIDHQPILEECRRVLKKGGSIILVENLKNNPITRLGRTYLKLRSYNYQSYPWNHFTLPELKMVKNRFDNSSLKVFHLFTPLSRIKYLNWLYPFLLKTDLKLLNIALFRNYAWLVLMTGKNK